MKIGEKKIVKVWNYSRDKDEYINYMLRQKR